MRLPIIYEKDPANISGCIGRYMKKLLPGQLRFYCKEASNSQKQHYAHMGWDGAAMSPHQPLGHNAIAKMIKDASAKLGLNVVGHAYRRLFISTLVNNGSVRAEEALATSRHGSVAAQ